MAAQVPAQFLLVPGEDNVVVDCATAEGKKRFHCATAALEEPYDLSEENLKVFLDEVHTRAIEAGWSDVLQIPSPALPNGQPGPVHDLLTQHGVISAERVQAHALTHVNAQNRNAQNSIQLALFIKKSLTKSAKKKISNLSAQCTVGGQESGAMLLKTCILEARTDTHCSTKALHERLRNIKQIMEQQGNDIKKVNEVITDTINSIHARGETPSPDLLSNLLEGCKTAPDSVFEDYVKTKERENDEEDADTPLDQRLTAQKLMKGAFNIHNKRVDKGEWMALTDEQEQIVALNAQIEELKKKSSTAKPKKKTKTENPGKSETNDGGDKSKNKSNKKKKEGKPAWMLKVPTDGKKTKVVNEKDYYWCPKHQAWVRHKPEECRLKEEAEAKSPKLKLSDALGAVIAAEE